MSKRRQRMEIATAVISGLCVAVPSVIATVTANKKSSAITDFKIEELTKKVNQHNNLIDRMYKAESRITVLEDEIRDRK
jgi:hypothetical protein